MRTFVAIDLPEEVKDQISLLLQELESYDGNIKWVKRQGMHITLKFLGEISSLQAEKVISSLEKISTRHAPFTMRIRGTGSFPQGGKTPRVLWIGLQKNEKILSLQKDLEMELSMIGFPVERRSFHPHLTLGRVKDPTKITQPLSVLERERDTSFGEWEVASLTFFRSVLKPTGAEYNVIKEVRFG
jgi:2'-5' RNA ligase